MRRIILLLCFSAHIFGALPRERERDESTVQLERWYLRAKIACMGVLGTVGVLAYLRMSKSLDSIDSVAQTIQPTVDTARKAIKHIEVGTRDVQRTIRALRPQVRRLPHIAKDLQMTLKKTGLTVHELKQAAAHARAITAKVDTLLTPQTLSNPQVQQAIQATTQSIFSGISQSSPQQSNWTPTALAALLVRNPVLITLIVRAWRSPVVQAAQAAPLHTGVQSAVIRTRRFGNLYGLLPR